MSTETEVVAEQPPMLQILTKGTTAEEVAALVAVFSALGVADNGAEPVRPTWAAPYRRHRRTADPLVLRGRGAWRASGLPR